jgi:hypothetical protein
VEVVVVAAAAEEVAAVAAAAVGVNGPLENSTNENNI